MIDIAELIQKIYDRAASIGLKKCRVYLVPPYKGSGLWHTWFSYVPPNKGSRNGKFANRPTPDDGLRELLEVLKNPEEFK